jgi:pimeloyl-ACP methyl ester carboxylesterase
LTAELAKITVPTLIIVGEREKMGFPQAEKMHELIKKSAIVNIPDAYHLTNLENSEQFNRAVAEFLKVEYERKGLFWISGSMLRIYATDY